MTSLLIGCRGFVGTKLYEKLSPNVIGSTRHEYDLSCTHLFSLPTEGIKTCYIVAAMCRLHECEMDPELSHQINVDAPISIARLMQPQGVHVVFISSILAMHGTSLYGRQKLAAEVGLQGVCNPTIIRPNKIDKTRLDEFCEFVMALGEKQRPGFYRWG